MIDKIFFKPSALSIYFSTHKCISTGSLKPRQLFLDTQDSDTTFTCHNFHHNIHFLYPYIVLSYTTPSLNPGRDILYIKKPVTIITRGLRMKTPELSLTRISSVTCYLPHVDCQAQPTKTLPSCSFNYAMTTTIPALSP